MIAVKTINFNCLFSCEKNNCILDSKKYPDPFRKSKKRCEKGPVDPFRNGIQIAEKVLRKGHLLRKGSLRKGSLDSNKKIFRVG